MNLLRTTLLLIFSATIIAVLAFQSFYLSPQQWEVLSTIVVWVIGISLACFLLGEITKNLSQVDKIWSIVPVVYAWYFAIQSNFNDRLVLMAILATIWGARLTYNFSRRGGYNWIPWQGEEDYRWQILRQNSIFKKSKLNLTLFNLFFISFYQIFLIFSFTLPSLAAMNDQAPPLNLFDILIAILFITLVVLETIADQQQFNFQNRKKQLIKEGKELPENYKKGFISSGLWGLVRHPNYACEQAIWVTYYLFSVVATSLWFNWSIIGCFLLILLFYGSSNFSESISAGKYPEYQNYIKRVPRFLPLSFKMFQKKS